MNTHVLSALFDHVDLLTICAASRVSHLWREAARDHPSYWKMLSLDALQMSAADVVLFMDRITAKRGTNATIRLFLRCPSSTSPLSRLVIWKMVIPLVSDNIYRVEELVLVISPAFAGIIWPLFRIDAPCLRVLQVIIDGDAGDAGPVRSLFNTSAHTSLERVFLRDLPLPALAKPLNHTLKSLGASYTVYNGSTDSPLGRVLAWFPRSITLDLHPTSRRHLGGLPGLPNLADGQLRVLRHLVIHHQRHLLGLRHSAIPILSISTPIYQPALIRQLVPEGGMLTVAFRVRMARNLCYAMTGRVVVATADGTRIREFRRLRTCDMDSPSFMEEIILSDRLVSLTIPLAIGFRTLCEHAYYLPRLQSLRLILNNLPDPISDWYTRAIVCPQLSSLTFQREVEEKPASISRPALAAFVRMAITVDAPQALHILLEDISFVGGEPGVTLECRPVRVCWDTVLAYRGAGPHWIYQNPLSFGLDFPQMH